VLPAASSRVDVRFAGGAASVQAGTQKQGRRQISSLRFRTERPRHDQEHIMNRDYNASSKQARSVFALTAVLATLLVVGSIEGLSQHYSADLQLAGAKSVAVAQR
jgi:hypothetical protein